METLLNRWCAGLAGRHTTVVLTDGDDPRTAEAARRLAGMGLVTPLVLARGGHIPGVEVLTLYDAVRDERIGSCLDEAFSARRLSGQARTELSGDPLYLGAAAVRAGLADGCVGGSARPTSAVIRAALRVIGLAPEVTALTSCFLIVLRDGRILGFGDCAVIPQPSQEQLAEIALSTSRTFSHLTGETPAVAMLSFSTKGSADHPDVELVRAATELVRSRAPDLAVDGELQFDAAFTATVGSQKAPGSLVAGRANVYVFPNLNAGNIGYKITERLAGATAIGPILQGLAAPMNDLSRGCSVPDIVMVALASAVQAVNRTAVPASGG
jgi:phosphotransacetylase